MSASSSDKISESANGGIPAVAQVTASRAVAVTSLSVNTQTNWPTSTGVKFSTFKATLVGTTLVKAAGTQTDWKGVSNGTNTLSNIVAVGGAGDIGNAIGDYVEMGPTAQWGEDIAEAFLHEHSNPSGAHSAVTTTSITNSGALTNTGPIVANGGIQVPSGQSISGSLVLGVASNSIASVGTQALSTSSATALNTSTYPPITLNVPSGYKVYYSGSMRMNASVAGYYDIVTIIGVDSSVTLPGSATGTDQSFYFTNNYSSGGQGANVAVDGYITGLPAGSHTFSLFGLTSAGQQGIWGSCFILFQVVAN